MTAIRALPVHMAMVPHDILFGVPDESIALVSGRVGRPDDVMAEIYREHVATHADV